MPEQTTKRFARAHTEEPEFTLDKSGKKTYVLAQTYGCSCPAGHKTFTYKTRVEKDDIDVKCPHCGKLCFVTMRH
jgi:hypothetical protein